MRVIVDINPHVFETSSRGPKHYIFGGGWFYSKMSESSDSMYSSNSC